jgi:D-glycero-beta-D-manno-heptose-7-phosphate kinase
MSKVIQQQKKYKILLLGESCLDIYVFGDVARLNPEAPVPVIKKTHSIRKEGMSGNVMANLKSMLPNSDITRLHNDFGIITKTRFIDNKSKYQLLRYDTIEELKPLQINRLTNDSYDAIVISDYNKGFLSDDLIRYVFSNFKNSKIFVDTKREDISSYKKCVMKINEKESNKIKFQNRDIEIITTLGSDGCKYLKKFYPVEPVEVHDVCGAGDTFLAALVVRWLETKDMESSIKTANNCAALSVTKLGCHTLTREEYENLRV